MSIHIEEHTSHVLLEVILALYQYQSCRVPELIPGVYLIYTNNNTRFIPASDQAKISLRPNTRTQYQDQGLIWIF
jgi:hypothetical protein